MRIDTTNFAALAERFVVAVEGIADALQLEAEMKREANKSFAQRVDEALGNSLDKVHQPNVGGRFPREVKKG